MNAKELSTALARNVSMVAEYLLPAGKKKGGEWCCGSTSGEAGESLKVRLVGDKAGVWSDFSTNQAGDLLDLWMAVRGCGLSEAMKQAGEFLGVKTDSRINSQKTYTKPEKKLFTKPKSKVMDWLTLERKLTPEAISAYRVVAKDDQYAVFPHLHGDTLMNFKARNIANKKDMRVHSGGMPCLFGWQAIHPDARSVTICEGEIDAITLYQYGFPAMSVFSGAGNHQWIDCEFDRLAQFSEIFICMDTDEAGMQAVPTIVDRLGIERCRVVRLPRKDANDCLLHGVPKEVIAKCFAEAVYITPDTLKRPSDYLEKVLREFYPEDGEAGVFLPWAKTFQQWRLRDSELTVWTGINGHGKSMLLGYVMLTAMEQGEKVCIASLEMSPQKTLWRLVRQLTGMREPPPDGIKQVLDSLSEKLWIFDVVGSVDHKTVLDTFAYARKRFGVSHFVVDSLTKIVRKDDDYNAQKEAVEGFVDFKNQHGGHIHLVTHARKGKDEASAPRKMDIKGGGAVTDLADNVVSVWRNKPKEEGNGDAADADAVLFLDKQRNGEWEGQIQLWFDKASMQYRENAIFSTKRHTIVEEVVREESF